MGKTETQLNKQPEVPEEPIKHPVEPIKIEEPEPVKPQKRKQPSATTGHKPPQSVKLGPGLQPEEPQQKPLENYQKNHQFLQDHQVEILK